MIRFVIALCVARAAAAQVLTFDEALERARQTGPAIVAARMRIEEARARSIDASLRFPGNPAVEVEAGRRSGGTSPTDYGVAVAQELQLPARRNARIDAARALVAQEEQRAREVEREVLREVATAFLRALESQERAAAATSGKQLADEALRIAERRYAAGDVAQLDVNVARTTVARAEADSRNAAAMVDAHIARVQSLLGMSAAPAIIGALRDASTTDQISVDALDRADVRLLDAEIAEAEAEQRLARTLRWPGFGVRASYAREEGDRILLGGIGLTLPIFDRGRQASAIASARLMRLRAEREALIRTVETEVRGAAASYAALRNAAIEYERAVLPLVAENERLALESYDVGQIGLGELLLVRREALDARRAFIDQLIEMRLAEVELRARAGVWK